MPYTKICNIKAVASATPVLAARAEGNIKQVLPSFNGFLWFI
nr:hypothetical protein [Nostoc sp. DedQUE01]